MNQKPEILPLCGLKLFLVAMNFFLKQATKLIVLTFNVIDVA